jgi:hypothetical protein
LNAECRCIGVPQPRKRETLQAKTENEKNHPEAPFHPMALANPREENENRKDIGERPHPKIEKSKTV